MGYPGLVTVLPSDRRASGPGPRLPGASRALLLALLSTSSAFAQPAPLRWPLDLKPAALSSTFGETRSASFHAGVDLKTWGKTGFRVHAVADGWVERLRASPWGYGRALYQRLDDGRVVVYGHLERFFEPAAERVRAEQRRTRQYTVDLWLKKGEIRVGRGQAIAWSGQSGTGPPHLHLEIRDSGNAPVNPLLQGIGPVADTTPPLLRGLVLMPVGPASTVDGGYVHRLVPLRGGSTPGRFSGREVWAWGRIGVGVDSHDRADEAPNKLAPLVHELHVDGQRILRASYRRFTYADRHQVALDRQRFEGGGPVYALLFRRPGNRLSFYETGGGGDGTVTCGPGGLEAGAHRLEVRASDAAGNESRAMLSLHCAPPPRIRWARLTESAEGRFLDADMTLDGKGRLAVRLSRSPDGANWKEVLDGQVPASDGPFTWELPDRSPFWRLSVQAGDGAPEVLVLAAAGEGKVPTRPLALQATAEARPLHTLIEIQSGEPLSGLPVVEVAASKAWVPVRQVGDRSYRAVIPLPGPEVHPVPVRVTARDARGRLSQRDLALSGQRLRPGAGATLRYLEDQVRLQASAGSAYRTLAPQARRFTPQASKGLRATDLGCRLGPADAAFDEPVRLWLEVPAGVPAEHAAVYSDNGRGRWVFRGREQEAGGRYLAATVRALGRFALMVDETPPEVSGVQPAQGSSVAAPRFSARILDEGSGIGRERDVVLELDGVRLVSEYDPEAALVIAEPDGPLTAGLHKLVITVRDRAANETRREVTFTSR